jgi:hypothetical protein
MLDRADDIVGQVAEAGERWPQFAAGSGVPDQVTA